MTDQKSRTDRMSSVFMDGRDHLSPNRETAFFRENRRKNYLLNVKPPNFPYFFFNFQSPYIKGH